VPTEPAPIEGVERTNVVMMCSNQRAGLALYNPYTMKVNRGRNCYICREFGYLV